VSVAKESLTAVLDSSQDITHRLEGASQATIRMNARFAFLTETSSHTISCIERKLQSVYDTMNTREALSLSTVQSQSIRDAFRCLVCQGVYTFTTKASAFREN
jgi:hypothetical protein